ncbi:MAG TPA: hypothetical protein VN756_03795 [Solirubrobacterales bacterium]|nr:hypothetical protein [Solirubrobacterales bacterium]
MPDAPDIPAPRPHVLGWGEFLPLILPPEKPCPLCGVKGSHNIITLGVDETRAILKDMRPPNPFESIEVRP